MLPPQWLGTMSCVKQTKSTAKQPVLQPECPTFLFRAVIKRFHETALKMKSFLSERERDNWTHWFVSRFVCPFIPFLRCCLLRNVSNCQKDSGVSNISPPALLSARAEYCGKPPIWIFNAELYNIALAARLHYSLELSDLMLWWTEHRLGAFDSSQN